MKLIVIAAAAAMLANPSKSLAQMVTSQVTASNGVIVDRAVDDFAGRSEYTAPSISFESQQGAHGDAIVARIHSGGSLRPLSIQGFMVYSGEWHYYRMAVFKGGDPVNYTRTNGEVGSCDGSCTLTENFQLDITPLQATKHTENGIIAVQLRADNGDTAVISIPVSYLQAVNEVAK